MLTVGGMGDGETKATSGEEKCAGSALSSNATVGCELQGERIPSRRGNRTCAQNEVKQLVSLCLHWAAIPLVAELKYRIFITAHGHRRPREDDVGRRCWEREGEKLTGRKTERGRYENEQNRTQARALMMRRDRLAELGDER